MLGTWTQVTNREQAAALPALAKKAIHRLTGTKPAYVQTEDKWAEAKFDRANGGIWVRFN
jgi:hypothetical protein